MLTRSKKMEQNREQQTQEEREEVQLGACSLVEQKAEDVGTEEMSFPGQRWSRDTEKDNDSTEESEVNEEEVVIRRILEDRENETPEEDNPRQSMERSQRKTTEAMRVVHNEQLQALMQMVQGLVESNHRDRLERKQEREEDRREMIERMDRDKLERKQERDADRQEIIEIINSDRQERKQERKRDKEEIKELINANKKEMMERIYRNEQELGEQLQEIRQNKNECDIKLEIINQDLKEVKKEAQDDIRIVKEELVIEINNENRKMNKKFEETKAENERKIVEVHERINKNTNMLERCDMNLYKMKKEIEQIDDKIIQEGQKWKTQKENINKMNTEEVIEAIAKFENISGNNNKINLIPHFENNGQLHPMKYLENIKNHAEKYMKGDYERYFIKIMEIVKNSLKGDPEVWFNVIEGDCVTFPEFERKFKQQYWSESHQRKAHTELICSRYDERKGGVKENYIINTYQTAMYLEPKMSSKEIIQKLAAHFGNQVAMQINVMQIGELGTFLAYMRDIGNNISMNHNEVRNYRDERPHRNQQSEAPRNFGRNNNDRDRYNNYRREGRGGFNGNDYRRQVNERENNRRQNWNNAERREEIRN